MQEITLLKDRPEYRPDLRDMMFEYMRELSYIEPREFEKHNDRESAAELYCKYVIENASDYNIYICLQSEELVGFAVISEHDRHPDTDMQICQIYVSEEHRRKGIGSALIEHILMKYEDKKDLCICILVLYKNNGAQNFWNGVFKKNDFFRMELSYVGVEGTEEGGTLAQLGYKRKRT